MSTKTTFKRVALVAVAALSLGVLSVAPSSAAVSALSVVTTNGTSTTASNYDSTTAATVTVTALVDNTTTDSVTVTYFAKSRPATAVENSGRLRYIDSTTKTVATSTIVDTSTAANNGSVALDSVTAGQSHNTFRLTAGTAGYIGANFRMELDSATARTAGTYTYTVVVKTQSGLSASYTTNTYDVSIVVSALASASTTASAAQTTAFIGAPATANTSDTAISAVATAAAAVAEIDVTINNASAGTGVAEDSVTATVTGPGNISFNDATYGKSITFAVTAGVATISIRADGTAGVGTIAITTKSGFSSTKTVTFYAKAASTLTTKLAPSTLVVGANDSAVAVTATDATGTNWAGAAYIVASAAADALIGGSATTPVACVYSSSSKVHWCPVTAIAAGTAKFKVIDAATVALATATSAEFSLTVSAAPAATVKLEFDKATYQPFEKAYIKVSVLDAAGNRLGAKDYVNALASGGITTNIAFSGTAPTLTATTVAINALDGTDKFGGYLTYVAYMPAQGDVTITAKGGTGLPVSGQVTVTATASVVNSSVDAATDAANEATDAANAATDAALAAADAADAATAAAQDASDAVAALSATVAKLVASLKAQITSLTNLVIKIQKKVRA
ncbi:hypothetical protein A1s21155_00285 [Candidatus Planktophila dulcis]|uniref:Uncharacterized protein n=1 Tax=Candidatus Planktophila dulcis TaxID=1884914 RepID=A0AAD0E0M8_9ACTN|nr:hypothetical protein [Candidatus Planktophila dulcis]ASY11462.1 hypothetical protein A1s21155_00285 [Candidatus Planktophila dulcis]